MALHGAPNGGNLSTEVSYQHSLSREQEVGKSFLFTLDCKKVAPEVWKGFPFGFTKNVNISKQA